MSDNIFAEIYNRILSLLGQNAKDESKNTAVNRLRLVLMQDRTNLTPEIMNRMRTELIAVLSRYVELDKEALELNIGQEGEHMGLILSIPVIRAKDEAEIEQAIKEEEEAKKKAKEEDSEEQDSDTEETQESDETSEEETSDEEKEETSEETESEEETEDKEPVEEETSQDVTEETPKVEEETTQPEEIQTEAVKKSIPKIEKSKKNDNPSEE